MRQALIAGWIAFAYLIAGVSGAHFWLDSGELGAAVIDLGVMHPPGAPGLGLLSRAASAIPLGTLGFRMAALSAFLGALAVLGVFVLLRRRGADGWVAWGAVAWLLAGWTFIRQARVIEVYALAAALLVLVLWGFDPAGRARRHEGISVSPLGRRLLGVFGATWGAWCFGDLRLAFAVPIAIAWVIAARRGRAWARWTPLVVVMATAVVLTVPLASARGPTTDWGNPETVHALWDHLQARSIREAYAVEILPRSASLWWHNLGETLERLAQDLGPAGPALTIVALALLWADPRRGRLEAPDRRAVATLTLLLVLFLFYAVGINPMGGGDRQTGIPVAIVAVLVVGEALRRVLRRMPRLRWALPPLLWTVLVLPAALLSFEDHVVTRSWAPHVWTRQVLAQLPPGALLLTQSDDLAAGVLAAKILEGARPDVVSMPAQHLHKPMPDPAGGTPAEAIWQAAARGTSESERIHLALQAHDPVAVEHPASGLFVPIAWWPEAGRLPLGVEGPGAWSRASVAEEIRVWLPLLPSREDRRRLAVAIASWARGVMYARGDIMRAGAALELSLEHVDPEHASGMVTLAALRDRVGDTAGAIALTRRALELEPDRPIALANLALYLGRDPATRAEALVLAERAAQLRPWRADAWEQLARLRAAVGDVEGAAQARREAESRTHRGAQQP